MSLKCVFDRFLPRAKHSSKVPGEAGPVNSDSDLTIESDGDYARLRDVSFPGPSQQAAAAADTQVKIYIP